MGALVKLAAPDVRRAEERLRLVRLQSSCNVLESRIWVLRCSETTYILTSKGNISKWLCRWHVGLNGKVLRGALGSGALHTSRRSIC